MAVAVDCKVLSARNKFDEATWESEAPVRNFSFDKGVFRADLRQKNLDDETKALKLKSVVGTGEATWFSPTAYSSASPYADVLA